MTENKSLSELKNDLTSLLSRAREAGYKNVIPKIPQGKTLSSEPSEHIMAGFYLRLGNWISGLVQVENNINPPEQRISGPKEPRDELYGLTAFAIANNISGFGNFITKNNTMPDKVANSN